MFFQMVMDLNIENIFDKKTRSLVMLAISAKNQCEMTLSSRIIRSNNDNELPVVNVNSQSKAIIPS